MSQPIKNRLISMRLTEDQYRYLDVMSRKIQEESGYRVTRASLVQTLIALGVPELERRMGQHEMCIKKPNREAKASKSPKKAAPRGHLRLAYTRESSSLRCFVDDKQ